MGHIEGSEANLLRGYACDVLENEKLDGVEDNQLVSMMKNDSRLLISTRRRFLLQLYVIFSNRP